MARKIKVLDLTVDENGFVSVVFNSPELPSGSPPVAHVAHRDAFADRAALHGYDPSDPDFHRTVLSHLLHEQHTEAPAKMKARPSYRSGVVEDLKVAETVNTWEFSAAQLRVLKRAGVTTEAVQERKMMTTNRG